MQESNKGTNGEVAEKKGVQTSQWKGHPVPPRTLISASPDVFSLSLSLLSLPCSALGQPIPLLRSHPNSPAPLLLLGLLDEEGHPPTT